jgi:ankyrin repeat protein
MKKLSLTIFLGICALLLGATSRNQAEDTISYDQFARTIRANDLAALRELASVPARIQVENHLHWRPLHYAALCGSTDAVRLLLEAGADTEALGQQDTTALIYAATDLAKTRLLVEKGARVNVAAKDGTTPLIVAASVMGNTETVRYLLDHGADVKAASMFGSTALISASLLGDPEMVRLLLAKGADAHAVDRAGFSSLLSFYNLPRETAVELLLKAGANVNAANTFAGRTSNGPIALTHLTPLMLASPYAESSTIGSLLKAGARINDVDSRKMTALMFAIATDFANPATVKQLLTAGADLNAEDQNGESALDWARKYRQPEILAILESAGARGHTPPETPKPPENAAAASATEALARALPLLAKTGPDFFKAGGGCNGCHHQIMQARVYAAAEAQGVPADERLRQTFVDGQKAERAAILPALLLTHPPPGDFERVLAPLTALADLHLPPDDFSDAMVRYLAARQDPSGAWIFNSARPPINESVVTRTAQALRALKVYGWPARQAEFAERINRARAWLETAKPVNSYEQAEQLMGLAAAGVPATDLRAGAKRLLGQQRPDGGWAQTPYLPSDSYATGLALHSLYTVGLLTPSDSAYRRGVAFLLRTQFPDGSWYVPSRAAKFQPYFQSGFPFNHDQWISSTGTAWAAIALVHAEQTKSPDARTGSF